MEAYTYSEAKGEKTRGSSNPNVHVYKLQNSKRGEKNIPRIIAIFVAKQYGQLTHQKITNYFTNIKPNSISTAIKRFNFIFKNNREIHNHIENICRLLFMNVD